MVSLESFIFFLKNLSGFAIDLAKISGDPLESPWGGSPGGSLDNFRQDNIAGSHGRQAMTEAAIFTIGRSRIIGYGKIRPLVNYRSRSQLLNFQRYI